MPNYGIHNYANREIGLTTPQVQMATFTPLEFKWQGVDPEFLSKHLQYADAKDAEARKEKTAIDAAYAEQRKQVHNDEESLKMFDAQVEDYNKKVKEAVDANMGTYHRLGNVMEGLKSEALHSKLIPALTDSNTRYQKWVDTDINARQDIDDLSKEYYRDKAEKNYSNNFVKDKDGNVIGSDWKPNVQVYADLHTEDIAKIALAFAAYQEKAGGGNSADVYTIGADGKATKIGIDKKGNLKGYENLAGASSGSYITKAGNSAWNWTKLTHKQLCDTLDDYLASSPQLREQIRDDFSKQLYKKNKAVEALKNRESLDADTIDKYESQIKDFDKYYKGGQGGGYVSYLDVYANRIKDFLVNSTYDRTRYTGGSGWDFSHFGSSKQNTNTNLTDHYNFGNKPEAGVAMQTSWNPDGGSSTTDNIETRLGK